MFRAILNRFKKPKERIYLDHAAATPVSAEVLVAMAPYFRGHFGNPSAVHTEGVTAREAIESARKKIAGLLHTRAEQVVFTASGTESNNLAIKGYLNGLLQDGRAAEDIEVISTKIEHPSIVRVLERLETKGVCVRYAPLQEGGCIEEASFRALLSEKTALVTFAYANSEIGTVQQVKRLSRIVKKFNTDHGVEIRVHLDASQAPLWLSCDMDMLGVDLMTLDAGKCCGPKGVGVLAYRSVSNLRSLILGGDQEFGVRAGTENTPLIVGCAQAIEMAQASWKTRAQEVTALRDAMIEMLLREIEGAVLNGSKENRIANNVNISIPDIDSEFAVIVLDQNKIAASTQSACSSASEDGSQVILEITGDDARARSTIRFSLGEHTKQQEIAEAVGCLKRHVQKMRDMQDKFVNLAAKH